MLHEILHDDVKLVGVGERKASLHEHILHFNKRQLKGNGKRNDRGLGRLIRLVRADLREELPVNIRLLIALRVRHAALINLSQKHLGKTLVDLSQRVIKGCRLFGGSRRRDGRHELFDCLFTNGCLARHGFFHPEGVHPAQTLGTIISMLVHIAVIYVRCNIGKQLAADLIGFAVKNDDVHRHFVFEKETANGVNRHFESLILRIAENAGGNQRERNRFAAVFFRQHERSPIA